MIHKYTQDEAGIDLDLDAEELDDALDELADDINELDEAEDLAQDDEVIMYIYTYMLKIRN